MLLFYFVSFFKFALAPIPTPAQVSLPQTDANATCCKSLEEQHQHNICDNCKHTYAMKATHRAQQKWPWWIKLVCPVVPERTENETTATRRCVFNGYWHEKKFRFWNLDVKRIGSTDPELGPLFGLQNEISLWHSVCFFKYNIMTFNM